jgi:hypothetical protein
MVSYQKQLLDSPDEIINDKDFNHILDATEPSDFDYPLCVSENGKYKISI